MNSFFSVDLSKVYLQYYTSSQILLPTPGKLKKRNKLSDQLFFYKKPPHLTQAA